MTISSARQRACASHFGAELGGGKAHGEREHGPANDDAETKALAARQSPIAAMTTAVANARARFVEKREIAEDAGEDVLAPAWHLGCLCSALTFPLPYATSRQRHVSLNSLKGLPNP